MVLLDKLWDDVIAGPHPEEGLGKLRKVSTRPPGVEGEGSRMSKYFQRSLSMSAAAAAAAGGNNSPVSPSTPVTPTSGGRKADNVWRSVFHPGSNLATKGIGADVFDKPEPNSPTVYDWLYSGDTRSKHHR